MRPVTDRQTCSMAGSWVRFQGVNVQRLYLLCDSLLHKRGDSEMSKLPPTAVSPHGQYWGGRPVVSDRVPYRPDPLTQAYLPRPPGQESPSKAGVLRRAGRQCP